MNLVTIAWKSIRQRMLASSLTALSVALGVMLLVAVLVINNVVSRVFNQSATAFHLVVGAKGGSMQLVLNTIYHVSSPIENIPYNYYKKLKANPAVEVAIPFCSGDVTQEGSFRIIGTIPEYFGTDYAPGRKFGVIRGGQFLAKPFDAVIGKTVAQTNGWEIGDTFRPVHNIVDVSAMDPEDIHVHDEKFTIVGILGRTGTPSDKVVFIHIDGFFQIEGHEKPLGEALEKEKAFEEKRKELGADKGADSEPASGNGDVPVESNNQQVEDPHKHHHHGSIPDVQKEVTAVLLKMKSYTAAAMMGPRINEGPDAQAAIPSQVIRTLLNDVVGNVHKALVVMTVLIIAVSGVSIFVSIYNSMADRRREIAVMRALGARRASVLSIILAESILLCVGGGILGILLGHGLVFAAAPIVESQAGITINPFAFDMIELVLLPVLIVLASLVGIIPGLTAYRTDVAKALSN